VSGDDIPVDIALDTCGAAVIVVTGTSPGNGTGLDIATVAWYTNNGNRVTNLWPTDGVRRYNNEEEDGDDRAAAVGGICLAVTENEAILSATVLGTSWGGSTALDDYTYHNWSGTSSTFNWEARYNNGGNDVAVAMSPHGQYVTGYSEGGSGTDFATISYSGDTEVWVERFNYLGDDDFPLDLHQHSPPSGHTQVWVTGAGMDGSDMHAATVRYLDNGGTVVDTWSDGWATSADFQYGKAVTVYASEPYITGSLGNTSGDEMLALSYYQDSPDYVENWNRVFGGTSLGGTDHEGRAIAVAVVDPGTPVQRSIFIVGVSTESGEGRQFTTWRYRE
jgi:hypothetical protein